MAMARKLKEKEEARRKAELDAAEIQQKDILASKERTDRERQAKLEAEKWADYEAAEEAMNDWMLDHKNTDATADVERLY